MPACAWRLWYSTAVLKRNQVPNQEIQFFEPMGMFDRNSPWAICRNRFPVLHSQRLRRKGANSICPGWTRRAGPRAGARARTCRAMSCTGFLYYKCILYSVFSTYNSERIRIELESSRIALCSRMIMIVYMYRRRSYGARARARARGA